MAVIHATRHSHTTNEYLFSSPRNATSTSTQARMTGAFGFISVDSELKCSTVARWGAPNQNHTTLRAAMYLLAPNQLEVLHAQIVAMNTK